METMRILPRHNTMKCQLQLQLLLQLCNYPFYANSKNVVLVNLLRIGLGDSSNLQPNIHQTILIIGLV